MLRQAPAGSIRSDPPETGHHEGAAAIRALGQTPPLNPDSLKEIRSPTADHCQYPNLHRARFELGTLGLRTLYTGHYTIGTMRSVELDAAWLRPDCGVVYSYFSVR